MFWNSNFLTSMAVAMGEHIKAIQFQLDNDSWADTTIIGTGTTGTDENHVYKYYTLEIPSAVNGRITAFRLLDENSNVIAQRNDNIVKSSGTPLFLKFRYRLYEEGLE